MGYIEELIEKGLWVFPTRGSGTYEEAKAPLSFKRDGKEVTWKSKEILGIAVEYEKAGHRAWGLWLKGSKLFGIDIDVRKAGNFDTAKLEYIDSELCSVGAYAEETASGGRHYIFRCSLNAALISDTPWVEYKYDGYFVIYPTIFSVSGREYRYVRICGELPPEASIEERDVRKRVEDVFRAAGISVRIVLGGAQVHSTRSAPQFPQLPRLEAKKILETSGGDPLAAAAELFSRVGCHGMAAELRRVLSGERVRVKKVMVDSMRIERTSRFLFLHLVACALRMLWIDEGQAREALERIEFIDSDEDPVKDSRKNAIDNAYRYSTYRIMNSGMCRICSAAGIEPCPIKDPYLLLSSAARKKF